MLGVQNRMADALFGQHFGEQLRFFDGDRTHQYRLALGMTFLDLPQHRPEFGRFRLIDDIRVVNSGHRQVRRDLYHVQRID